MHIGASSKWFAVLLIVSELPSAPHQTTDSPKGLTRIPKQKQTKWLCSFYVLMKHILFIVFALKWFGADRRFGIRQKEKRSSLQVL